MPRWLKWTLLGLGAVMIAASLAYFAYATLRAAAAEDWPVAEGRVVATRIELGRHTDEDGDSYVSYDPVVAFDYRVDGRTLRSERLYLGERETFDYRDDANAFLADYPVGAPLEVYYNPGDPTDAAVIIEGPSWLIFSVTAFGIILFVLGWFVPVERKPRSRSGPGDRRPSWLPRRPKE